MWKVSDTDNCIDFYKPLAKCIMDNFSGRTDGTQTSLWSKYNLIQGA